MPSRMPPPPEDAEELEGDEEQEGGYTRPSKSQLKRDMHDLQDLGEALVAFPEDQLNALEISESLLEAIRELKRTRTHGGRRRQMQYIGKLMRGIDAEPIRAAVEAMQRGRDQESMALHEAERWRARFMEGDEALTEWVAEHPAGDLQKLRSLIRAARAAAGDAPAHPNVRAFRELFRFIKARLSADA
jgi:ribosome-associated protein